MRKVRKTPAMRRIEAARGEQIEVLLTRLYSEHGNQKGVADELGMSVATVSLWMMRLGIETRASVQPAAFLGTPAQG